MCEMASISGILVLSRIVFYDEVTALVSVQLESAFAGKVLLSCTEVGTSRLLQLLPRALLHMFPRHLPRRWKEGPVL